MAKYKVFWEVREYAIVEAKNEREAIDIVAEGDVETISDEMTTGYEAIEIID